MGPLSRLRAWLGDLFGGTDGDSPASESRSTAEESARQDDTDGGAAGRLDPNAATETRTEATDDAVDALRDVRRNRSTPGADDAETPGAGAEPSDGDPTDGDLTGDDRTDDDPADGDPTEDDPPDGE